MSIQRALSPKIPNLSPSPVSSSSVSAAQTEGGPPASASSGLSKAGDLGPQAPHQPIVPKFSSFLDQFAPSKRPFLPPPASSPSSASASSTSPSLQRSLPAASPASSPTTSGLLTLPSLATSTSAAQTSNPSGSATPRSLPRSPAAFLESLQNKSPKEILKDGVTALATEGIGRLIEKISSFHSKSTAIPASWASLSSTEGGYSSDKAHALLAASDYAFGSAGSIQEKLSPQGYKVTSFDNQGTQAFLAQRGDHSILAFRGTEFSKPQDILTDLKWNQKAEGEGNVHAGFQEALDAVWPEVQKALAESGSKGPLWVTGHSLGGALATLAASRLEREGTSVGGLYTFGSPRVGDAAFATAFDKSPLDQKTWRVENHNDIVTQIPPPSLAGGYQHIGQHVFFDGQGQIHHNPSEELIRQHRLDLSDPGLWQRDAFGNNGLFDPMRDHDRGRYFEQIQKEQM